MSTTALPNLTPIQEQALAMMAVGMSMREIAAEINVHRNTLGNWRRTNPAFAKALAEAQYDRVLYWRDAAEEHAHLALYTVGKLLEDPKTPPSVRLRAALAILKDATTLPPAEPAIPAAAGNQTAADASQTAPAPESHESAAQPAPAAARPIVHNQESPKMHNLAQSAPSDPTPSHSALAPTGTPMAA